MARHPIPLRWVHLAAEDSTFSVAEALATVLRNSPELAFTPGRKFAYSSIGYWLLGKVVEQVSGQSYPAYVTENIIRPRGLSKQETGFVITGETHHANGYLKKYSLMNWVKGVVIDRKFVGDYERHWLRLNTFTFAISRHSRTDTQVCEHGPHPTTYLAPAFSNMSTMAA